ncbi:conserved hypothetical protein [Candidatus Desulfosporosinus infrequens]|uniref:Winged helix-turn helix domain-containing protein n=1 Tax=Candidatus Desulfosporosinus infrequens TaxID=2043169 RepID=A0A2U3LJV7_9FIRM|nr:conserved hypothetical protein [Candidatus Desulfosporosinus infrequens]
MTKQKNHELQNIIDAMKSTNNRRMFERYQAVKLYLEGYLIIQIAEIIGRNRITVSTYIHTYLAEGLSGLKISYSQGRPSFLTESQKQQVKHLVSEQRPEDVGFPAEMNWTCPLLREWIKRQFKIQYTDRGVLKLLKELGFSCTRPTYTLAKANTDKQEEFKKICESQNSLINE